ncbi:MAG TPA: hypothetical protein VG345_06205, partial [Bryobacteraceae bacterium]|nr:hypothetical protein [Bryobacteraceae bacterium]
AARGRDDIDSIARNPPCSTVAAGVTAISGHAEACFDFFRRKRITPGQNERRGVDVRRIFKEVLCQTPIDNPREVDVGSARD